MATYSAKSGLSKSWKVVKSHEGFYTGGKVSFIHTFGSTDGAQDKEQKDQSIIACLFNDDVAIVNACTGQLIRTLQKNVEDEERESLVVFAVRPFEKQLVTAGRNLLLRLWDLETYKCVRIIKAHASPVLAMDFDPTGTLLATGGSDRSVRVFDINKAYCTHHFQQHRGIVTLVRFHPDPKRLHLFSCGDDNTVRIYDLYSQAQIACITEHMSTPTCLSFSSDGYTLFSAGRDKIIHVWDLRNHVSIQTVVANESVEGLEVLPKDFEWLKRRKNKERDNTSAVASVAPIYFVTAGAQGILRLWQQSDDSFEVIHEQIPETKNQQFTQLLFHSKKREFIAVTAEENFLMYNERLERTKQIIGYNDDILCLKYIPKEDETPSKYFAAATNSAQVRILNRETLSCDLLSGHTDIVMSLAVSPDGRWLVSASKDRTARLWDFSTRQCIATCSGHSEMLTAIAISQRSAQFPLGNAFFVTGSADKTIKMWNLKPLRKQYNGSQRDDRKLPISSMATVKAHDKDVNAISISPNDRLIASASQDKLIKIWNAQSEGTLLSLCGVCRGHKRGVWAIEFSPVDKCLASASGDKSLRLWSITNFSCLRTFEGHTASVLSIQFACAGMQLLSSGADGLVKLWTIKSNECEATFDQHLDKIWSIAVTKDSSEMISGGADSIIHIWNDHTQKEESEFEQERQSKILKEQELYDCLRRSELFRAIDVAFDLGYPHRLFLIFHDLIYGPRQMEHPICQLDLQVEEVAFDSDTYSPEKILGPLVAKLSEANLKNLLNWMKEWNTNTKHSFVAQILLSTILEAIPPEKLKQIGVQDTIDGFIAYTERHYHRLDRLVEKSFLVDFNVATMKNLLPQYTALKEKKLREKRCRESCIASTDLLSEVKRHRDNY
uniref:U3 small nucleolar RNAassociated protein putative n=1 Tax=Albugo laibachii Nc14 TaxID=890382 RepID=F0WH62_9STRA|nr:U3 small nucleolar RNAassociated protein putative [Albugo laibachii Nc14]|eukprot:CCA20577.1 U3 small nucleolar RNAassociated protein putative [Albugo laibachii Nc14]